MTKSKEEVRFFEDVKLAEIVNLTADEIKFFDELEWNICKSYGYTKLSGGHCMIIITDIEDKRKKGDGLLLHIDMKLGVEGEYLDSLGEDAYDRELKNIIE